MSSLGAWNSVCYGHVTENTVVRQAIGCAELVEFLKSLSDLLESVHINCDFLTPV
jgi:hypothetical protein